MHPQYVPEWRLHFRPYVTTQSSRLICKRGKSRPIHGNFYPGSPSFYGSVKFMASVWLDCRVWGEHEDPPICTHQLPSSPTTISQQSRHRSWPVYDHPHFESSIVHLWRWLLPFLATNTSCRGTFFEIIVLFPHKSIHYTTRLSTSCRLPFPSPKFSCLLLIKPFCICDLISFPLFSCHPRLPPFH